jgi:hypothetical protein
MGCISSRNDLSFKFHDLETLVYWTQFAYKRGSQSFGLEITSNIPEGTPKEKRKTLEVLFRVTWSYDHPITCHEGTEWERKV